MVTTIMVRRRLVPRKHSREVRARSERDWRMSHQGDSGARKTQMRTGR
ncbi:alpha glucoside transporter, partial [Colletotrichum scovillei]